MNGKHWEESAFVQVLSDAVKGSSEGLKPPRLKKDSQSSWPPRFLLLLPLCEDLRSMSSSLPPWTPSPNFWISELLSFDSKVLFTKHSPAILLCYLCASYSLFGPCFLLVFTLTVALQPKSCFLACGLKRSCES